MFGDDFHMYSLAVCVRTAVDTKNVSVEFALAVNERRVASESRSDLYAGLPGGKTDQGPSHRSEKS